MHSLATLIKRAVPHTFPTLRTDITDTGSTTEGTETGTETGTDTGTETGTGTADATGTTDTTDSPISPPPVTSTNTTTSTFTSTTTTKTSKTKISTSITTTAPPTKDTDTTSNAPSNPSPAPITPAPLAVTTTSPAVLKATTASITANFTTVVTTLNGQVTTFTSQLPTALINFDPSSQSNTHRTTVIAGTTTALCVFIFSLLAAIFVYRKHKLRRTLALSEKRKEGRGLLDGEGFDDDDAPTHMRALSSQSHSFARSISASPAPSHIKSRVSQTGSIFREEIWPPPGFVDPIAKRSGQVDLSNIVDDVMGPTGSMPRDRNAPNTPTAFGSSEINPFLDNNPQRHHHASSSSSPTNMHNDDPFASSASLSSFYSSSNLPLGASLPTQPGVMSPSMITASHSYSVSSSASFSQSTSQVSPVRPVSSLSTAQPRTSSPLSRTLTGNEQNVWDSGPAPPEHSVGPLH